MAMYTRIDDNLSYFNLDILYNLPEQGCIQPVAL